MQTSDLTHTYPHFYLHMEDTFIEKDTNIQRENTNDTANI